MGPHPRGGETTVSASPVEGDPEAPQGVFAQYRPPFDLTSDMLVGLALCPTVPLRRNFPGVPFLSVRGRTPVLIWFARITDAVYRDPMGRRRSALGTGGVPYNELNVLTLLWRRALFVPGIYATSELSIRIGLGYGMPKRSISMEVQRDRQRLAALAIDGARQSVARARFVGSGEILARIVSPWLPLCTWPVRFPSGSQVRGQIREAPRVQIARVHWGQLSVEASWLPKPLSLLPVGLYLPGQRMRLPPPQD